MTVDMSKRTDDELVFLYSQGNNKAIEALVKRYESSVSNYLSFLVQDKDWVNDLYQETWIKVIGKLQNDGYQSQGKFKSWLFRVVHNLVMDHYRKDRHSTSVGQEPYHSLMVENTMDDSYNAEQQWIYRETLQDLYYWISCLSSEQQDMILMRFHKNMSFKEIAEKRGISINTALGRMRYALINLRKIAQS